ncbi:MAG: NAD(P)/FAD-dependent oxidoreductase [Bacteroidota bacterium]
MKPTILVLGGGIGGVTAARELSRKIGNEDGIDLARIQVFEREKRSLFAPSLTWMMIGKREEGQLTRDLSNIEYNGIEMIYGEVESIDPQARSVVSNGVEYKGDYMIISLGTDFSDEHQLESTGHNIYTIRGASAFHEDLQSFTGGEIAVVVSSLPHKSPVAPYEAALLIDDYLSGTPFGEGTTISLYTPEQMPMAFASREISDQVLNLMEEKGIQYHPNHQVVSKNGDQLLFETDDGEQVKASIDLLAYIPGHRAPEVIRKADLTGASGWIEVDEQTLETRFEGVYAIGDNIRLSLPNGSNLPMAGIFAQYQAATVAHNIARLIQKKSPDRVYEIKGSYILDQGGEGVKVSGNFGSDHLKLENSSMFKHWEKVLTEKSWFLKNF